MNRSPRAAVCLILILSLLFGTASGEAKTTARVRVGGSQLALREKPATSSDVVAWIPAGAQVAVYSTSGAWRLVRYGEYVGYCLAIFLETDGETADAPAPGEPEPAAEPGETFTEGDFSAVIDPDGTAAIVGYTGQADMLTIPAILGGAAVTRIDDEAFFCCMTLTSVTLPDGVTEIGSAAFMACSSLRRITLPDSLRLIRSDSLRGCPIELVIAAPGSYAEAWATANGMTVAAE